MKQAGKRKIKQWLKAAAACGVILTLVLTPEVLVLAEEAIQKTGQVLEQQRQAKEQEDYLKENAVSGKHPGNRGAAPYDTAPGGMGSRDGSGLTDNGTENGSSTENSGSTPGGSGPENSSGTPDGSGPENSGGAPDSSGTPGGSGTPGSSTPGAEEPEGAGTPAQDPSQDASRDAFRDPAGEEPLTLPDLPSEDPDAFDKRYGEPVEINEYGKIYRMDGENYKLILTPDPEVYRDEDGELKEIDNTLVPEEQTIPGGLFRKAAKATAYTNKAGAAEIQLPETVTEDNGIRFTDPQGRTLELYPAEGEYGQPAVLENAILYNDVFRQTDIQYTVLGSQVKEDIILREPGTARAFPYWFSRDRYTAVLENNVVLIYDREEGEDPEEPCFTLSAPAMSDAAGEVSEAVTLTLKEEGNRYLVSVCPDDEWLNDPARHYPVKIDPTIRIPSANLEVVTTSSEKGTYSQAAYGCAGYVDSQVTGIPGSNLGRTRMFFRINHSFKDLIPEEAAVTSATLNTYEYSAYKSTATFACYRLKEAWSTGTITWDNSVGIGREIAGEDAARPAKKGWQSFDIRQSVNDWIHGLAPQHGLMVMATSESTRGATFYTPASNSAAQPLFKPEYKPYIEINWNYPDPVPPDYPLDNTALTLRTMMDCHMNGKLQFLGVFADGTATPGS